MGKNRHLKIIDIMQEKNVISIKELAKMLDCTEMTVRRNLDELQAMDFVKREHGYVTLLKNAQATDYYEQIGENTAEKRAIASVALQYIKPFQNICLDSGTTIQQLVNLLPEDLVLSVITSSLTAAMKLSQNSKIQVLIPSGFLHHSNRSVLFNEPDRLDQYKADIAFISCRSLRIPGGTFEHSQVMTMTKRALAEIAAEKILLLDYSKWGVNSLCSTIDLNSLDIIITDDKAPLEYVEKAASYGKEILVVNPQDNSVSKHYNPSAK